MKCTWYQETKKYTNYLIGIWFKESTNGDDRKDKERLFMKGYWNNRDNQIINLNH